MNPEWNLRTTPDYVHLALHIQTKHLHFDGDVREQRCILNPNWVLFCIQYKHALNLTWILYVYMCKKYFPQNK